MTKTLTLPLVWEGAGLHAGPFFVGFVAKTIGGPWIISAGRLRHVIRDQSEYPTREAAQAALEAAVMELGVKP